MLDAADVLPAALELAHDIAENTAPMSVAASKRLLWDSFDLDRRPSAPARRRSICDLMRHDDAKEGVRAFLERRPPRWTGESRQTATAVGHLDAGGTHVLDGLGAGFLRDAGGQVQQHPGGETGFDGVGGGRHARSSRWQSDDVDFVDAALPQPVRQRRAGVVGALERRCRRPNSWPFMNTASTAEGSKSG